jgi:hypothetical protein
MPTKYGTVRQHGCSYEVRVTLSTSTLDIGNGVGTRMPCIYDSGIKRQQCDWKWAVGKWWPGVELNYRHADFQSLLQIDLSY